MKISTNLKGAAEAIARLQALPKQFKEAEVLGITRVSVLLRDSIVKYTDAGHPEHPMVQTGRLRSSIRYVVEETPNVVGHVGSDAEYAPYVEFGHSQTPGRYVPALGKRLTADFVKPYPFVRPAMTEVFDGGSGLRVFSNAIKEKLKF